MKTNDHLLVHMIERDMKRKRVECYHIMDVVEVNPTEIEVKANEAVYVHYFQAHYEQVFFPTPFYVKLQSGSNIAEYHDSSTLQGGSYLITSHFETIQLTGIPFPLNYHVHYVRVKF